MISFSSSAQVKSKTLRILNITEYEDGCLIKAIDSTQKDTLNIISANAAFENKNNYIKMKIGGEYLFSYEECNASPQLLLGNFTIRIKHTVVWKAGDRIVDLPVYAKNTKGIWIMQ